MNELYIKVNDDKLAHFSEFVSEFRNNTLIDCETLTTAFDRLKAQSSTQEMYEIGQTVEKINDIVTESHPTLKKLSDKIDEYVSVIRKLKAIAGE